VHEHQILAALGNILRSDFSERELLPWAKNLENGKVKIVIAANDPSLPGSTVEGTERNQRCRSETQ
jgi:acylphosphatase